MGEGRILPSARTFDLLLRNKGFGQLKPAQLAVEMPFQSNTKTATKSRILNSNIKLKC